MFHTHTISNILAELGVEHSILCTGSRSAPITLSFGRNKLIQSWVVYDERSAGYIALGLSQVTRKPTVVVVTSGTAAVNLAPAVTEAYYQKTPLLVITADRPQEWIGQAEGQAINQKNLFGNHVKRYLEFPTNTDDFPDKNWLIKHILIQAVHTAIYPTQGPVHINIPLREPFYPNEHTKVESSIHRDLLPQFFRAESILSHAQWSHLLGNVLDYKKMLIVAGSTLPDENYSHFVMDFAQSQHIPIVADVTSNLTDASTICRFADYFLDKLSENELKLLAPEVVWYIGDGLVSKRLLKTLSLWQSEIKLAIRIQICDEWQDIFRWNTHLITMQPGLFFRDIRDKMRLSLDKNYLRKWKLLNAQTQQAIQQQLDSFNSDRPINEWSALLYTIQHLPEGAIVHLGNSLSVRLANYAIWPAGCKIYHNRGTSGIDGSVSTAIGNALANPQKPVFLFIGDVSLLYDQNAFLLQPIPPNLKILLLNNHGGGIFKLVEDAAKQPDVDTFFVGKQLHRFELFCVMHAIKYVSAQTTANLIAKLSEWVLSDTCVILEIETNSDVTQQVIREVQNGINKHLQFKL